MIRRQGFVVMVPWCHCAPWSTAGLVWRITPHSLSSSPSVLLNLINDAYYFPCTCCLPFAALPARPRLHLFARLHDHGMDSGAIFAPASLVQCTHAYALPRTLRLISAIFLHMRELLTPVTCLLLCVVKSEAHSYEGWLPRVAHRRYANLLLTTATTIFLHALTAEKLGEKAACD